MGEWSYGVVHKMQKEDWNLILLKIKSEKWST